jgi:heme A synthase
MYVTAVHSSKLFYFLYKKEVKMKDVLIRALKTFIQGFLGALAVTLPVSDLTDQAVIKSLLIGAIAAGISAVMNLTITLIDKGGEIIEGN